MPPSTAAVLLALLDDVLRCVVDVGAQLDAVTVRSRTLVDETSWQAAAVAAYRRDAGRWTTGLQTASAGVRADEADLRTWRATLLAQASTCW